MQCTSLAISVRSLVQSTVWGIVPTNIEPFEKENIYQTYLHDLTMRIYRIIMAPTKRSIDNFGFLIVGFYGSSVEVRHEVAHLIVNRRVDIL